MALPALIEELREVIGLPAALALVEKWGGVTLFVPKNPPEGHPLAQAIGIRAARKLSAHAGLEYLRIPRCAARLRAARDAELLSDHAAGLSAAKCARKYHLTERQVWRIFRAGPKAPSPQRDLFPSP